MNCRFPPAAGSALWKSPPRPPALDPRRCWPLSSRLDPAPRSYWNRAPATPAQLQSPLPKGGSASPDHTFLVKAGPRRSPGPHQSFRLSGCGLLGLRVEDSTACSFFQSRWEQHHPVPKTPPSMSPLPFLISLIKSSSIRRGFKTAGKLLFYRGSDSH